MKQSPDSRIALRPARNVDSAKIDDLLLRSYSALLPPYYDAAVMAAALPLMVRSNPKLIASGRFLVAVLGDTGVNFGAGMTGGFAYVLDIDRDFVDRYNHELIDIHRVSPESMEAHLHHLRSLIMAHIEATGSEWGEMILEDYRTFLPKFWLVKPKAAELGSLIESLRQAA